MTSRPVGSLFYGEDACIVRNELNGGDICTKLIQARFEVSRVRAFDLENSICSIKATGYLSDTGGPTENISGLLLFPLTLCTVEGGWLEKRSM